MVWSADERESPESHHGGAGRGRDVAMGNMLPFSSRLSFSNGVRKGTWK